MFCKNCRSQIEDNSEICPICGVRQFDDIDINYEDTVYEDNIRDKVFNDDIKTEVSDYKNEILEEVISPNIRKIKKAIKKQVKKIIDETTEELLDKTGIQKTPVLKKAFKKIRKKK
ncbi:hypothetical protein SAMN05216349_108126 [Oribacterium sp. KHPX15]|uniref:hypothetical protein n=1 Tax=Oribacterium sp. KHPX15 TaxID=1855342 RepID=UPI0008986DA5|nr:hypothetical protein [Oribacterium sp. KHPX15]SEA29301.1 hypothetical protein SAMN05216349_108126 [Oribacterium sp. KHPX15]